MDKPEWCRSTLPQEFAGLTLLSKRNKALAQEALSVKNNKERKLTPGMELVIHIPIHSG